MDQSDRRDLYNGFGDALARAVELVVTPAIFGYLGWLADRHFGTTPVITIVLFVLVFGYVAWRMWYGYEQQMQGEETRLGIRGIRKEGP